MEALSAFRYSPWLLTAVLVSSQMASALSPDPKILSLIPHSGQIVQGSGVSSSGSTKDRRKLLIFTQENALDLDEFEALAGVDESRFIRQAFLVCGREHQTSRIEHSLLTIGHFNQARIYEAAIRNGAHAHDYRGINVIELLPFSRDRGAGGEIRWMAVVESELAIYGTVSNVREELDRYLDHVPADPALLQTMSRLSPDDETWCILPNFYEKIRQDLGSLDSGFLGVASNASQFHLGIHYGKQVRIDYEFGRSSSARPWAIADAHSEHQSTNGPALELLNSTLNEPADAGSVSGVISVSRAQYDNWFAELSGGEKRSNH